MQLIKLNIVCFFFLSFKLFSQSHILKTNPILFATGFMNVTYEHALNEKSSVSGGMGFTSKDGGGLAAQMDYRFYITHRKLACPEGFFIGPVLLFIRDDEENFYMGALLGYQWIYSSGVSLDLGIGPQYSIIGDAQDGEIFAYGVFSIGYSW